MSVFNSVQRGARDVFDGPAFDLNDIPTPGGPTFHEGMGFLMASEGWDQGPCTFDPASSLQDLLSRRTCLSASPARGLYIGKSRDHSAKLDLHLHRKSA